MKNPVIIGSRGSDLALWQAHFVQQQLSEIGVSSSIEIIKTKGDAIQHLSFDKIEGKGFFTKEIEEALIANEIDLAVHSHKDLETSSPEGLMIAAFMVGLRFRRQTLASGQVFVPFRSSRTTKITVAKRLRPSRTTAPVTVPTVPGALPVIVVPSTSAAPLINLNSATSDQLDTLPGVGPSTAKAIISYRNRKGPFGKVEDLLNVPGIGPSKVAAIRDQVTV